MTIIYTGEENFDQTGICGVAMQIMAARYEYNPDCFDVERECFVQSAKQLFGGPRPYSIGDVIEAAAAQGAVVAEFEYLLVYFSQVSLPLWRRLYALGSRYTVPYSGIDLYPFAWTYPEYLSDTYIRSIACVSKDVIQNTKSTTEYFLFRYK